MRSPAPTIAGVRRAGKIVLVDTDGPTIGLHFGMTGRVVVDGAAPIARLQYASGRDDPQWDRLRVFTGGDVPAIRFNDPRRLGRLSLDPDVSALGVDFTSVTAAATAPGTRRAQTAAIKTVLLDQTVVAGLGNLCADEVLWWAGIDPRRPAEQSRRCRHRPVGTRDSSPSADHAATRWKSPWHAVAGGARRMPAM